MTGLLVARQVLKTVTSVGAMYAVGDIFKAVAPANRGRIAKVVAGIGVFVIADMVSDKAGQYMAKQFDEMVVAVKAGKYVSNVIS